jgi:hypothetical protein
MRRAKARERNDVTTAPAVLTAAPVDVHGIIQHQRDCLRMRKYEYFAHLQKIVFERTDEMYIPPELEGRLKNDPEGISIDFFGQENWLPLGIVKIAGQADFLLPLAPILRKDGKVGFPDKPDASWMPPSSGRTPIMEKDSNGIERWTGKLSPAPSVKMVPQPLRNFSRGILRGTNFIVYERVAQLLLKPHGLAEGWIATCSANQSVNPATHMALLLDHQTGEAHFYGGQYMISRPGVMD